MIIREWKGRASIERADEYPTHFRAVVMHDLRSVRGFLGAELVRRDLAGLVEFTVLSRWESMDAVRSFSTADLDQAVLEPGAVSALTDFDAHVTHYDVVESIGGQSPQPGGSAPVHVASRHVEDAARDERR